MKENKKWYFYQITLKLNKIRAIYLKCQKPEIIILIFIDCFL